MVLGLMPRALYNSLERDITAGDRFLLYTDGLLEASQGDEFFGEDRVRDVLARSHAQPAEQCVATMIHEVGDWAGYNRGRPHEDDLTVVIIDICRS